MKKHFKSTPCWEDEEAGTREKVTAGLKSEHLLRFAPPPPGEPSKSGKVLTPAPPIVVVPLTILISDASRLGHKEGSVQPAGVLFWFSGLLSGSQNLWSPSDPQSQHVHTPLALQRWRGWTLLSQIGWTVTFMAHHSWPGELQWAVGFVHMFYTGLLHAGDQGLSLL